MRFLMSGKVSRQYGTVHVQFQQANVNQSIIKCSVGTGKDDSHRSAQVAHFKVLKPMDLLLKLSIHKTGSASGFCSSYC
jgi:hypothetical protein